MLMMRRTIATLLLLCASSTIRSSTTTTTSAFVYPQSRTSIPRQQQQQQQQHARSFGMTVNDSSSSSRSIINVRTSTRSDTRLHGLMNGQDSDEKTTSTSTSTKIDYSTMEPKVYPQRWVQLAYLSMLALLSDWICFSVAAAPDMFEQQWGHSAASLIDIFLFTNVASCFVVTDIVAKYGLQTAIQGSSFLMALGCWFRSGPAFLLPAAHAVGWDTSHLMATTTTTATILDPNGLVPYPFVVIGTLMVGAAQPFFQCTPPLLSAQWFGSDERATSTAIALNFNQVGIATAFLVGGAMANSATGLEQYFGLISIISTVVAIGTLLQFQNLPPSPPSSSELEKLIHGEKEPPFLESVKTFFNTPGFTRPLAAFICSISVTNIVGAFIDDLLSRGGVQDQFQIDLAGAGFEFAILLGGIVIGGYVDRTKQYKSVTLACLLATTICLIPLGLTEHAIGTEPILLVMALLALGFVTGPVQPINAELAVDVTYPGDETAVESVQQIGGNLISALLVPLAAIALEQDYQFLPSIPQLAGDIRGDVVLMMGVSIATLLFFSNFDAPLKRSIADEGDGHSTAVNGQMSINGEASAGTTTTTTINADSESMIISSGELQLVLDAEVVRD